MPIIFTFLTALSFLLTSLFLRHLETKEFDALTVYISTQMVASALILVVGISVFWKSVQSFFSAHLIFISLLPMILETIAKNLMAEALSTRADSNRIFAIVEMNNILLVVFEWSMMNMWIDKVEAIGYAMGLFSSILLYCIK